MSTFSLVSVHGGHSGSFCGHADDTLEQIVSRYAELKFEWVCLTEHMPSEKLSLIAPEDAASGFAPEDLQRRFDEYFVEATRLKALYEGRMEIFVGFETDAYSGYEDAIENLLARHDFDMMVGSVHHVHDLLFDGDLEDYARAIELSGSIQQLYCDYFDVQLELINRFEPAVVGHFDLIRIHDAEYMDRWNDPKVRERAFRNLLRIKELNLILDLNVRSLSQGASEPYLSKPLMGFAIANEISMVPGDDSHGVESVGLNIGQGVEILVARGGSTTWTKPSVRRQRSAMGC